MVLNLIMLNIYNILSFELKKNIFRMSPQTISQYKSRDDLIEVLLASCTIPFYFSGYPAAQMQRDLSYAVDGVFSVEIDRFSIHSLFIIVTFIEI